MNKISFLQMMKHPETINQKSLVDLETVVEEYPYFTIGQSLLLAGYINTNDDRYDEQLTTTACVVPNRDKLRTFVMLTKLCREKSIENSMPSDEINPLLNEFFTPVNVTEQEEGEDAESVIKEKMFIIPEINLKGSHEELSAEMALLEEKRKSLDELKEIVANRIRELEDEKTSTKEEEKPQKKMSKKELIDKFISENPSISRPKAEFFNPISVAQNSIIDHESIVSETLADIYIKQGYIDKAISVYEKLSLKYPEKSVYFATFIKQLKNNNQ